jgi:hypothetical protein
MDRNDIRAVINAYNDLKKEFLRLGVSAIDTEDLVEAVERLIDQKPETYYRGPDIRRKP